MLLKITSFPLENNTHQTNQMNLKKVSEFEKNLKRMTASLNGALGTAHNWKIRTDAEKLKQASLVFGRQDLAIKCGELVLRAERVIALSNPPTPKKETGRGHKKSVASEATLLKSDIISKIRKAAQNFSDDEFEKKMEEAREGNTVPTRSMLLRPNCTHIHNSGDFEWYTPQGIIESARQTMGSIDLDPASCEFANKNHVKADKYFNLEEDGLSKEWVGNVWMNPPFNRGIVNQFMDKLISHVESRTVQQAITICNNNTECSWLQRLLKHASAVCFHSGRVGFYKDDGQKRGKALQGQVIAGLKVNSQKFKENFAPFGACLFH